MEFQVGDLVEFTYRGNPEAAVVTDPRYAGPIGVKDSHHHIHYLPRTAVCPLSIEVLSYLSREESAGLLRNLKGLQAAHLTGPKKETQYPHWGYDWKQDGYGEGKEKVSGAPHLPVAFYDYAASFKQQLEKHSEEQIKKFWPGLEP